MLKTAEDEIIYRIANPCIALDSRRRRTFGRNERPKRLPCCALRYPVADQRDLASTEFIAAEVSRRHPDCFVVRTDPAVDLARVRISGDDRAMPSAQFDFGRGLHIEPHFRFTIGGVGAVTGEALIGKDGADIAIEFDGRRIGSRDRHEGKQTERRADRQAPNETWIEREQLPP